MKKSKKIFPESGQTLAEVVVALGIAAIVIVALIALVITSLKNAQFAQNQAKATKYAQEAIDQVKVIRDRDSNVNFNTLPLTCVSGQCVFSDLWKIYLSSNTQSPCILKPPGAPVTDYNCYFMINNSSSVPVLEESASKILENGLFTRQIIMSDNGLMTQCGTGLLCDYRVEKKIIVKVSWTDSGGSHQSNLQTVLRKP